MRAARTLVSLALCAACSGCFGHLYTTDVYGGWGVFANICRNFTEAPLAADVRGGARFAASCHRSPDRRGRAPVRSYLHPLLDEPHVSHSSSQLTRRAWRLQEGRCAPLPSRA